MSLPSPFQEVAALAIMQDAIAVALSYAWDVVRVFSLTSPSEGMSGECSVGAAEPRRLASLPWTQVWAVGEACISEMMVTALCWHPDRPQLLTLGFRRVLLVWDYQENSIVQAEQCPVANALPKAVGLTPSQVAILDDRCHINVYERPSLTLGSDPGPHLPLICLQVAQV